MPPKEVKNAKSKDAAADENAELVENGLRYRFSCQRVEQRTGRRQNKRAIAIVNGVTEFEGKAKVQYCPEGNETTIRKGTHTVEIANDEYGENRGIWVDEKTGARIKVGPMRAKGACWVNDKAKVCAGK